MTVAGNTLLFIIINQYHFQCPKTHLDNQFLGMSPACIRCWMVITSQPYWWTMLSS